MPRDKAPKPANLATAQKHLDTASQAYDTAVEKLLDAVVREDHADALKTWAIAHLACLLLKDALNGLYRHLAELMPAPVKKPPRQEKAEHPAKPTQVEEKRGRKGRAEPVDNREDDADRDAP